MMTGTITTTGLREDLTTQQVIDLIFKDPNVKYGLTEFHDLRKSAHEILQIYPKIIESGRTRGEVRYYLKCFKRGTDIQVYAERKSNPEEIVRQLWLYKLHYLYSYPWDYITVEHPIYFGTVTADKPADILVFQRDGQTAKIIIEVKRPERKDGINQLKSYLNAEGSPIGVWSNGQEQLILYRPYPSEFEDTLTELPTFAQGPRDVLTARLTIGQLKREFDFKRIIQNLEELVLANYGGSEFDEIFKIIFAKLYDEQAAKERQNQEVAFRKSDDPDITYDTIGKLFRGAKSEWSGIFDEHDEIKLSPQHLQICIGPLERIRLLGANMRVMDDAFEYLMPQEMKKKHGQFFTPRHVIDMCVKILNPSKREFVMDPACGSAGFLIHVLDYVWPADTDEKKQERKYNYAAKYLWGIDFGEKPSKVARALMLIAGDGRSHTFRVNSLDPREWLTNEEGAAIRTALREFTLLANRPPANRSIRESDAWDFYRDMKFDVLLTNPPFAGEIRDRTLLRRYELAKRTLSRKSQKGPKEERDVLFIERCLQMLKPSGRLAIVLPQGKLNNASLAYIREWLLHRAKLLAVVGLHPNTFKPHTGTKTSVLFLQKYTEEEISQIQALEDSIREKAPDYVKVIQNLIGKVPPDEDLSADELPDELAELLQEQFTAQAEEPSEEVDGRDDAGSPATVEAPDPDLLAEEIEQKRMSLVEVIRQLEEIRAEKKRYRKNSKDTPLEMAAKEECQERLRIEERRLKSGLKVAEKELLELKTTLAMLTIKGQLSLLLADPRAVAAIGQKWVDAEVAKQLDYPVFMATSEKGGKDSSGEYLPLVRKDEDGNIIEIVEDNYGNLLVDQDCIAYRQEDPPGIAEAFIGWAKRQKLTFWRED